jgi:hypothetical protein
MMANADTLINRFRFHPANEKTGLQHEQVRDKCLALAEFLAEILPEGRELSLATAKVEEVMFWANAAIARQS